MTLKAAVFDWDGTLLNSAWPIMNAYHQAFDALGLRRPDNTHLQQVVGRSPDFSFQILMPELEDEQLDQLCRHYHRSLAENSQQSRLFEGVPDMLDDLRSRPLKLAVATSMKASHLEYFLDTFGVRDKFDAWCTADRSAPKPDPAMLRDIFMRLGVEPCEAVMVGDSDVDIQMAEYAGCRSIGVSFDGRNTLAMQAAQPDAQASSIPELQQLIAALG